MAERRWDGDEIGVGIGDAGEFAPHVRELLESMVDPGWVAEDPQLHLLPKLRAAIDEPGSPWRLLRADIVSAVLVLRLEWARPEPSLAALRADVFALLGRVAESTTHVQQRVTDDRIEYEAATGIADGEAGFRAHGHMLRFAIVGPAAAQLAAGS